MIDYSKLLIPEWAAPEPFFEFTELQRRAVVGRDPWRIVEEKRTAAHLCPSGDTMLLDVHPEAISVGSPLGANQRMFWSVVGAVIGFVSAMLSLWSAFSVRGDLIELAIVSVGGGLTFLAGVWFLRLGLFSPSDWPVLFNRKTRQVTFFKPILPHFLKFWQPGTAKLESYSWESVRVRGYKYTTTMAARTFRDSYSLCLLWGEEDNPKQFKDHVAIGEESSWQDDSLFRLWEHIRRYMEEGGPPILPGERLRDLDRTKLPQFPPEIIAAAGGPALGAEDLAKLAVAGQA